MRPSEDVANPKGATKKRRRAVAVRYWAPDQAPMIKAVNPRTRRICQKTMSIKQTLTMMTLILIHHLTLIQTLMTLILTQMSKVISQVPN